MTKATIELIDQLCDIIDKSKYLILSGTMAVGKTYLANLIAERCREAKYNAQGIYNKKEHKGEWNENRKKTTEPRKSRKM